MTLSNAESREPTYTADGLTATYAFSFPIYAESDLQVTVATSASPPVVSTLVLTTDYTVTLASTSLPSAGSITLVAGNLTVDYKLSIRRVLPLTQLTNLVNQGSFFALTHEQKFDKLVMAIQQIADEAKRATRLPEQESPSTTVTLLPDAATRASKVQAFDSSGNVTAISAVSAGSVAFTAFGEALVEAANASAGRDVLGATSGKWLTAHITDKNITAALLASSAISQIFQARLTTRTSQPVWVADQLTQTTVYVTPYTGDKIALYDGTDWRLHTLTQISAAVPSTTNTNYDVFIYDSAGLTLDLVAWSTDTARATGLTTQNGVLVKNGATGRRYVGSFRTTGVSGNTEDSAAKRYVWNYYNRVPRTLAAHDSTNTWAYTTATWRQARATATNQVEVVIGVDEVPVNVRASVRFSNTNLSVRAAVGIALDATNTNDAQITMGADSQVANEPVTAYAEYYGYPGIGQHELVWTEISEATGATTWEGDNGIVTNQVRSGLIGSILG